MTATSIQPDEENGIWKEYEIIYQYKNSIRDTIDSYIEYRLNELIEVSSDLNCFETYHLTFSKKGRLKKITIDHWGMSFWERLFDKDYRKCKRIIRKAFRKIRIDFVDPKYEFYRDLDFYDAWIEVYEPTFFYK